MNQIDLSMVDWARAQFALTAMYHWIFVPLTLGLSFLCAFYESLYVRTGKEEWKKIAKFWKERGIYEKSLAIRAGGQSFVFYEGPPTANLLSPVVIHWRTRLAVQAIQADSPYSHQHPLLAPAPVAPCL